jgi:hypothetical protein
MPILALDLDDIALRQPAVGLEAVVHGARAEGFASVRRFVLRCTGIHFGRTPWHGPRRRLRPYLAVDPHAHFARSRSPNGSDVTIHGLSPHAKSLPLIGPVLMAIPPRPASRAERPLRTIRTRPSAIGHVRFRSPFRRRAFHLVCFTRVRISASVHVGRDFFERVALVADEDGDRPAVRCAGIVYTPCAVGQVPLSHRDLYNYLGTWAMASTSSSESGVGSNSSTRTTVLAGGSAKNCERIRL